MSREPTNEALIDSTDALRQLAVLWRSGTTPHSVSTTHRKKLEGESPSGSSQSCSNDLQAWTVLAGSVDTNELFE